MNQESRNAGSSVRLHPSNFSDSGICLLLIQLCSWIPGFLITISVCSIVGITSRLIAGDAVAIGYNSEGIWTGVTYYASSKPKGGKDYKTEAEAREEATRDLQKRSVNKAARIEILSSSDSTGFVAVARGQTKSGKDANVVGRGATQNQADKEALAQLSAAGAGAKQKIVYRYFSHGGASRTGD
jgi:hypothetical protein